MRIVSALLISLLAASYASAQTPAPTRRGATGYAPSDTTEAARLIREIHDHQQAVADLEYLADVIGPRLTGSASLLRAHQWAESTMKSVGAVNVHREGYAFGPSWTRGTASGRLISDNGANLGLAQLGWSPSTAGTVRGEVIRFSGAIDQLAPLAGRFKGKIILASPASPSSASDSATLKSLVKAMVDEGALAYLSESDKALSLNMGGSPNWRFPFRPQIPNAILSQESFQLLDRLAARGSPVTVELTLPGTRSPQPVQAFNTIGEIRGSEKPDEVVVIGAHMDSWDLGTGATDNGTGTVSVIEALRAIKALGVQPKRTIRAILFSGEEQGLLGSKAYVAAHRTELPQIQAVLIDDLGTGRINGWALQKFESARPFMATAIGPLNELGVTALPLEFSNDSDHGPFADAGVPAFFGVQDQEDYFLVTHHSQFDTFSHVKPESLVEGATALAVTAWELANMDERLPHRTGN